MILCSKEVICELVKRFRESLYLPKVYYYERRRDLRKTELEGIKCQNHSIGSYVQNGLENQLCTDLLKSMNSTVIDQEFYSVYELWLRIHLIIDHISGMTDEFALETYQMLEGIQLLKT